MHRALTGEPDGRGRRRALRAPRSRLPASLPARERPARSGSTRASSTGSRRCARSACAWRSSPTSRSAFTVPLLAQLRARAASSTWSCRATRCRARSPIRCRCCTSAQRFGVPPARIVAIGDSINDALAARAAGHSGDRGALRLQRGARCACARRRCYSRLAARGSDRSRRLRRDLDLADRHCILRLRVRSTSPGLAAVLPLVVLASLTRTASARPPTHPFRSCSAAPRAGGRPETETDMARPPGEARMTEIEFKAIAAQGYNRIPLLVECFADLDTPLSLYLKLRTSRTASCSSRWSAASASAATRSSACRPARCCARRPPVPRWCANGKVVESFEGNPLDFVDQYRKRFKVAVRPGPAALLRRAGGLLRLRHGALHRAAPGRRRASPTRSACPTSCCCSPRSWRSSTTSPARST